MRIYFSGIGGVGIGPLAMIAHDAGYDVCGSDISEGLLTESLQKEHIPYSLDQSGNYLRDIHTSSPVDWFVYTSALPSDHPELLLARELGIQTSKRDELLAHIIAEKNLKLIAVAGTHGKTTTTGMMVWTLQQLGIPVSYSIGSTLSWGPSGKFDPASEHFVYECDEFDRNFLYFHPYHTLITSIEYDHPDTYPTEADYFAAFETFISQSAYCTMWQQDSDMLPEAHSLATLQRIDKHSASVREHMKTIQLAGQHNRENAYLVLANCMMDGFNERAAREALGRFPGTRRRFEKIADSLYSDYGHTPAEITATLQLASELSERIVLVYQPHQNIRQHELLGRYTDQFIGAETTYWLPTYLSREDPALPVLTPQQLTASIVNREHIAIADLDDQLWHAIQSARRSGALVLCMGAGSIDGWVRDRLARDAP
jgi:UDP-N-acetylmuramate--alanine ligase